MQLDKKMVYVSPEDKQKCEVVIGAACKHFDIERGILFKDASYNVIAIKQMCIYLMKVNTKMSDRSLAAYLNISKSSVSSSVEKIRIHKKIYADTANGLKHICKNAHDSIPNSITIEGI